MTPTFSSWRPPSAGSTVDVSIINGGHFTVPLAWVVKGSIPGHEILSTPCYSFLIESKSQGERILFDLGFMKAWKEKQPPSILGQLEYAGAKVTVERDVADQLRAANVPLESINAIVWSHHHFDHTGDPSLFPTSTSLVVGPGFKTNSTTFPGYPENPEAVVLSDAFDGREVVELDFSNVPSRVGGFPAVDYFGDGSFFLLRSFGHTHDHVSALARTSEGKFIFLGGDVAHHPGAYRPTPLLPLPDEIVPSPLDTPRSSSVCPGSVFAAVHPARAAELDCRITPFYELNPAMNASLDDTQIAVDKMKALDGAAEVFVIIAHDESLRDILPFFPKRINDWDEAGYKRVGTWRFLKDFVQGVQGRE
ncbi:metallo-beta-lactamase superfamily protein [Aspergillus steynii IBT 23096]|uniref:Metallo-beta-lactamase superfamily protein n=1 Tax=Aspergillus steynii IBT 23096 TaxID=1392250 RepID=A0A2I2G0A7_9EURO|nr:metallo-beta-lactamase superfamily protein [Aspergillus steynii IBT 23096]PLB46303.1 metallo-beta-lactamase superfamily protein [Aspergillus steynii IBT 23096]